MHRVDDRVVSARLIGLIGVAAAFASLIPFFFPGMLVPGRGEWLMGCAAAGMFVLGALMLAAPERLSWAVPCLLILGDWIWASDRWAFVNSNLAGNPVYLCILAATAGAVLSPRMLVLKSVNLIPVLLVGFAAGGSLHDRWLPVVVHLIVLTLVPVGMYLSRRRHESLLRQLRVLSGTDALTGLNNRRELDERLPELVDRAAAAGHLLAAIMVDIDHFKAVNDEFGHLSGDAVLVAVGEAVRSETAPDDLLVRLGGEEFLIITTVLTERDALELAERVRLAVAGTRTVGVPVTCSVGVATSGPTSDSDPIEWGWELIRRADEALYEIKQADRDGVAVASLPPTPSPDRSPTVRGARPGAPSQPRLSPQRRTPTVAGCPTPIHPVESSTDTGILNTLTAARITGWIAAVGTVLILLTNWTMQPLPGAIVVPVIAALTLLVIAITAFTLPERVAALMPVVLLLGPLLWAATQVAASTNDLVRASAVSLLPIVVAAAFTLSARTLLLVLIGTTPAVLWVKLHLDWSIGLAIGQTAVDMAVLAIVAAEMFWLLRRSNRAFRSVQALSRVDPLTGTTNRRHLDEHAPWLCAEAATNGALLAAILIDLDHFKAINDSLGHQAGDEVLRQVGAALAAELRDHDVATRSGGEEFLLTVVVDHHDDALNRAEHLRRLLTTTVRKAGPPLTCSIGVATACPDPADDPVETIWNVAAEADRALYRAKTQGRDQVVSALELAG